MVCGKFRYNLEHLGANPFLRKSRKNLTVHKQIPRSQDWRSDIVARSMIRSIPYPPLRALSENDRHAV